VVLLLCLVAVVFCSLPSKKTLRYKQVTGVYLGDNSVNAEAVQEFSIQTEALVNGAVTNSKLAPLSVTATEITPGSVTSDGLAVDLVRVIIGYNLIPATTQNNSVNALPFDSTALKPPSLLNSGQISTPANSDNPDSSLTYHAQGIARGPGIILGWYPSKNGHLLRYQTARALRGLTCADVEVGVTDTTGITYTSSHDATLCTQTTGNVVNDCTSLSGCIAPNATGVLLDPFCQNYVQGETQDNSPDRCGSFTNTQDVTNPQEGVPVYSSSVERVTIDDDGVVEIWFYGRGSQIRGYAGDIEVTVVVLLNESVGASPPAP